MPLSYGAKSHTKSFMDSVDGAMSINWKISSEDRDRMTTSVNMITPPPPPPPPPLLLLLLLLLLPLSVWCGYFWFSGLRFRV